MLDILIWGYSAPKALYLDTETENKPEDRAAVSSAMLYGL